MRVGPIVILLAFTAPALAGPRHTEEPTRKWLTPAEMMNPEVAKGYPPDVCNTADGSCREICGNGKSGKRTEIFFHSMTGRVVKSLSL